MCDEPAATYERASDEHGCLEISGATNRLVPGGKVRLIPGHCDPTVNLYDWYVGIRAGRVEQLWPITLRRFIESHHLFRSKPAGSIEAKQRDPIRLHLPILRADRHSLEVCLGDDQPIERVVVMARQPSGVLRMAAGD